MNQKLSICITAHNDNAEINNTIHSLRETVADDIQIIVIDDASPTPVALDDKRVCLHRNPFRRGVGPSRQIASQIATFGTLLFLDAHMRFDDGWYEAAMARIGDPMTLWCATCLGLGYGSMDVKNHKGEYFGAQMCYFDPATKEVFEGKWNPAKNDAIDFPITCLMGASYFVPKKLFTDVGGLSCLRFWGSDEPYLSSKAMLAGGKIMCSKAIRIGHEFRDHTAYSTPVYAFVYNKLRCIYELFDYPTAQFLTGQLSSVSGFDEARRELAGSMGFIGDAKQRNSGVFKHDMRWVCETYGIRYPSP